MNKIKGQGLDLLIQEGFLNFLGEDEEVLNCLSEDLTLEEINISISTIEKFIEKLYNSMRKLTELENKNLQLEDKLDKENQNKQETENKKNGNGLYVFLLIAGICITVVNYNNIGMWCGISMACISLWQIVSINMKNEELEDEINSLNTNIKNITKEQEETINLMATIYSDIYISPKFLRTYLTSPQIVQKIIARLGILLTNLKKFKVIQEDSSLTSSAKMLAISQLFMLLNQSITNAKMLSEQQAMKENMEEKIDQSREILKELKKQNDLMELNTYNKLSELQGHDPVLVAATTYAQLDRIRKEHDK